MNLKFIDRKEELIFLEERYRKKGFEFFVIYGRRRIGKTELIKQFLKDKPHIYLLCDKSGTGRNILRFKSKIAEYLDEPPIESNNLEEIFSHLVKKTQREQLIIAFDEFSYLVEKDNAAPSLFQVVIDEILQKTNMFLILCGSSISMMEKGVLSSKSALYGRKTAHMKIGTIPFSSFHEFFPSNSIEKNVESYAILGGVPFYLEKFSDKKKSLENAREQIFDKTGHLYEEIDFLLQEELREPDVYKGILTALASGHTKVVDIANASGIKVHDIDKYLKVLIRLGIIKKENPITTVKSKKTTYSIDDNFFSFSFSFSEPYKSNLEIGELKTVEQHLQQSFNAYVGKKFEKLVREELIHNLVIMTSSKTGKWWGHYRDGTTNTRREIEIDIVALDEHAQKILFGECKWQNNVDGNQVLQELTAKTNYFEGPRKYLQYEKCYLIVAKSFKKKTPEKNVYYFDLKDLEKLVK